MNPAMYMTLILLMGQRNKTSTGNRAFTSTFVTALSPGPMRLPMAAVAAQIVETERAAFEKELAKEFRAVQEEAARVEGSVSEAFLKASAPKISAVLTNNPAPAPPPCTDVVVSSRAASKPAPSGAATVGAGSNPATK